MRLGSPGSIWDSHENGDPPCNGQNLKEIRQYIRLTMFTTSKKVQLHSRGRASPFKSWVWPCLWWNLFITQAVGVVPLIVCVTSNHLIITGFRLATKTEYGNNFSPTGTTYDLPLVCWEVTKSFVRETSIQMSPPHLYIVEQLLRIHPIRKCHCIGKCKKHRNRQSWGASEGVQNK